MKYTCCERLMWHIIAPASLRYLSKRGWDAPSLKKKAKMIYRQIVKRTPNIGGLTGNSLHICLVAGMIWLSIYEAAEGKMGEECFGNLVVAGMESPMVKASFTGKAKTAFTRTAQQKRAAKAVRDNAAPAGRSTGRQRSSWAGMRRSTPSSTTSVGYAPWAVRRDFPTWCLICAHWTRCPSTGWEESSTAPKRWPPEGTAATSVSAKRVPNGTENGERAADGETDLPCQSEPYIPHTVRLCPAVGPRRTEAGQEDHVSGLRPSPQQGNAAPVDLPAVFRGENRISGVSSRYVDCGAQPAG